MAMEASKKHFSRRLRGDLPIRMLYYKGVTLFTRRFGILDSVRPKLVLRLQTPMSFGNNGCFDTER